MSDSIDVKMTGVEAIASKLAEIAIASPKNVRDGTLRIAAKIERSAKGYCPVDSGRLRSSITHNWTGSGIERKPPDGKSPESKPDDGIGQPQEKGDTFVAVIGTNVVYGPRIEFGFHGIDKLGRRINQGNSPYMYPAYFEHSKNLEKEIASELGKTLAKAMRK